MLGIIKKGINKYYPTLGADRRKSIIGTLVVLQNTTPHHFQFHR